MIQPHNLSSSVIATAHAALHSTREFRKGKHGNSHVYIAVSLLTLGPSPQKTVLHRTTGQSGSSSCGQSSGQPGSNEAHGRPIHSVALPITTAMALAVLVGGIIWWFRRSLRASVLSRGPRLIWRPPQAQPQVWDVFLTRPLRGEYLLRDLQVRMRS